MSHVAKLFSNGRSQAVRLPAAYRFDSKEVFIRKDPLTGDIILSRKPETWDEFFQTIKDIEKADGFLEADDRHQDSDQRDPFADWQE